MSTYNAEWMSELAKKAGETSGSDAKEKTERDARWTSEFADELTVAISLREWEKAVALVEEGTVSHIFLEYYH